MTEARETIGSEFKELDESEKQNNRIQFVNEFLRSDLSRNTLLKSEPESQDLLSSSWKSLKEHPEVIIAGAVVLSAGAAIAASKLAGRAICAGEAKVSTLGATVLADDTRSTLAEYPLSKAVVGDYRQPSMLRKARPLDYEPLELEHMTDILPTLLVKEREKLAASVAKDESQWITGLEQFKPSKVLRTFLDAPPSPRVPYNVLPK